MPAQSPLTIPMEIRPARMRFRNEIWERTHGWRSDVDVAVEQMARLLDVKDLEGIKKAVEVGKPDRTYGYLNDPRAFFQALLAAQGVRQQDAVSAYHKTRDTLVQGEVMIANQITISDIKADIGSIGGHIKPGISVVEAVRK